MRPVAIFLVLCLVGCQTKDNLNEQQFKTLLHQLATAWTEQNTVQALVFFTDSATYMQPPDQQLYQGREQLQKYFGALKPGTVMYFHQIWFDAQTQTGVGEFTFGNRASQHAVTGTAVVALKKGRIHHWREYFIQGPKDFKQFIATEGKRWKWHIGNYP